MFVQPIRDLNDLYNLQQALFMDKKYRELLLTQFLYNTNLRVSDALKFKWMDIIQNGVVLEYIYRKEQKTKKNKVIPITRELKEAIETTYVRLKNPPLTEFIFKSSSNRKRNLKKNSWSRSYVTSFLKEYARKVGITDNIGAHSMRKTFGYQAYKEGMQIHLISKMMNHSSIQVTEVYCGIRQDTIIEGYKAISALNKKSRSLFIKPSPEK